jgi:hypothetical protein
LDETAYVMDFQAIDAYSNVGLTRVVCKTTEAMRTGARREITMNETQHF